MQQLRMPNQRDTYDVRDCQCTTKLGVILKKCLKMPTDVIRLYKLFDQFPGSVSLIVHSSFFGFGLDHSA